MKKNLNFTLFFALIIFCQFNLSAQNNQETKTLFGNGSILNTENLGFFVSPSYGITQIDGATASLLNVRGGLSFNDKYAIGGYFNTSINDFVPQSETLQNVYMDYWTVGGFFEYNIKSNKITHLTFPLYIGYGEVQMDNEMGDTGLGEASFFQIEPAALLEVNLHKYIRFNVGAGYRIVSDMNYRNINQSDLSGLTGYVGLKFGLFE